MYLIQVGDIVKLNLDYIFIVKQGIGLSETLKRKIFQNPDATYEVTDVTGTEYPVTLNGQLSSITFRHEELIKVGEVRGK